jgi:HPr kinase/phosphorylase
LTVAVRELLDKAGALLELRLVAGARGLDRPIALPRLQLPGLALAGYLPQLKPDRVQVLGNSEVSYLGTLAAERARDSVLGVARVAACLVVTNGTAPPPALEEPAEAAGVPLLSSGLNTGDFIRSASAWLEERLAPETQLHGDLLEMHGLGVLILGKSGIGKSEAALDLVSSGHHRLVADDVVLVRRISPTVLRGRAAALLRHHMEIRGLGVMDVEALFGTLATLEELQIDFVVELIEWPGASDRTGLLEDPYRLLDVPLPHVRIPVRPGRSNAVMIETAARNHLLQRRGRHAALGFSQRLDAEIARRRARRVGGGS